MSNVECELLTAEREATLLRAVFNENDGMHNTILFYMICAKCCFRSVTFHLNAPSTLFKVSFQYLSLCGVNSQNDGIVRILNGV